MKLPILTLLIIYISQPLGALRGTEAVNHRDPIIEPPIDVDQETVETDNYSQIKNEPIIPTNVGDVKGRVEIFNDEEAMAFYGIRYAKPPVHELRFRKPEPMDAISIAKFGLQTSKKVGCVQPNNFLIGDDLEISEDCLHLNIWVPEGKVSSGRSENNQKRNLPVMVWIHGGSFHIGSGNQDDFNGIVLSTVGNVIVVTLNYRLGFFGFLNAGITSAAGNMGLYDQAAALKWVKSNIEAFGGDPDQITVFGESAGGMSVALLTVSPETRNLFNRAIIQSGSPYSPIRPESKAKVFEKSLVFSKAVNCSYPEAKEFTDTAMKCLRDLDYQLIDDYGRDEKMHSQILPNPIFGDEFIPDNVHTLMKHPENINHNLQVLLGITRDEGFFFLFQQIRHLLDPSKPRLMTRKDVDEETQKLLSGRPIDPIKATDYYFRNMSSTENSETVLNKLIDMYGDLYINCPVYYLTNRYMEIVGHENTHSYMLTKATGRQYVSTCKDWSKICHGDEIVLVFGVPLRHPHQFNHTDRALSEQFVRLWTDFAKTGKVPWISDSSNWFVELPIEDRPNFHPEKINACEAFWREVFETQMNA